MGLFFKDDFERRVPSDKELRAESFKKESKSKKEVSTKPVVKMPTSSSYGSYNLSENRKTEVKKAEPAKPVFAPAPVQPEVKKAEPAKPVFTPASVQPEIKKAEPVKPVFAPAPVQPEVKKAEPKDDFVSDEATGKTEENKVEKPVFVPLNQNQKTTSATTKTFKSPKSSTYIPKDSTKNSSIFSSSSSNSDSNEGISLFKIISTGVSIITVLSLIINLVSCVERNLEESRKEEEALHQAFNAQLANIGKSDMINIYNSGNYSRNEVLEEFIGKHSYVIDAEDIMNDLVASGEFDFFDKAAERLQEMADSKSNSFKTDDDMKDSLREVGFEEPEIAYAINKYHMND